MTRAEYNAIEADVIRDHLAAMWVEDERLYRCPTCGWEVRGEFGATHGYSHAAMLADSESWACYHDASSALALCGYVLEPVPACTRARAFNQMLHELWEVFDDLRQRTGQDRSEGRSRAVSANPDDLVGPVPVLMGNVYCGDYWGDLDLAAQADEMMDLVEGRGGR